MKFEPYLKNKIWIVWNLVTNTYENNRLKSITKIHVLLEDSNVLVYIQIENLIFNA